MGVRLHVFTGYYQYLIHISLSAEGVVEKPDVVGAIFGQTEGLLGEDLDLRISRGPGASAGSTSR